MWIVSYGFIFGDELNDVIYGYEVVVDRKKDDWLFGIFELLYVD